MRLDETDGDRPEDAKASDGIVEFLLGLCVERSPRLTGIRPDMGEFDEERAAEAFSAFERTSQRRLLFCEGQNCVLAEGITGCLQCRGNGGAKRQPGRWSMTCV